MPFLARRSHTGPGRFLQWKVRLFAVGAVLLLVGMAREIDILVAIAIAVLAVAFLLRFLERDEAPEAAEEDDEDESTGDEADSWDEEDEAPTVDADRSTEAPDASVSTPDPSPGDR
jgi:hypothetical protein